MNYFDSRPGAEALSKKGLGLLQPHSLSKNANTFSLSVSALPREKYGAARAVPIAQIWRVSAREGAQRTKLGDVKARVLTSKPLRAAAWKREKTGF